LHAISMRPAPPLPALGSFACTFLAATFLGLTLRLPVAGGSGLDAGPSPGRGRGTAGPGGREPGEGMRPSLPPLDPKKLPMAHPFEFFRVRDGKDCQGGVAASFSFRLLGKPQDFREEKGGGCCPRKKSQQTARAQRLPRAVPPLSDPRGAVGKCDKRRKCWTRVRGVSRAASPPGPRQGAWPSMTSAETAGLAAESEGGSRDPSAPRHACPGGPRGTPA
jgi:hypothetical protein